MRKDEILAALTKLQAGQDKLIELLTSEIQLGVSALANIDTQKDALSAIVSDALKQTPTPHPEPTIEELRSQAFMEFINTGDILKVAPDGYFKKGTEERLQFGPYVFVNVFKVNDRTLYYRKASDREQLPRSAVMLPKFVGEVTPGYYVMYHDKIVTELIGLDYSMWQERGITFNSLFRK